MSEYSHEPSMFNTVNLAVEFRVWPSKSSHIDTMSKINSVCAVYFITLGQILVNISLIFHELQSTDVFDLIFYH